MNNEEKIKELEKEIETLNDEVTDLERERDNLNEDNTDLKEKLENLENKLEDLEGYTEINEDNGEDCRRSIFFALEELKEVTDGTVTLEDKVRDLTIRYCKYL